MKKWEFSVSVLCVLSIFFVGCNQEIGTSTTIQPVTQASPSPTPLPSATPTPAPTPRPVKLSFFLTNDIHGHVENMGLLGGILNQVRARPEYQNDEAGFILVDSGDQFQGTLTSNYDEGETVFKILNQMGYDAVIPGNHDYDFGPKNWQYDRVTPPITGLNPFEVIEDLSAMGKFPMLSANTYIRDSIKMTGTQQSIPMNDSCVPINQSLANPPDFAHARRPKFLSPYTIITRAGVRIALIGIDFHDTTSVTTGENVSTLCFRDEDEAYLEVRKTLEGQADVFVMLMHNGNVLPSTFSASNIAQKINTAMPGALDLVAAGHTHQTHNNLVGDVHVMQDGCNATEYGRVDLYVDAQTRKVIPSLTASWAGLSVNAHSCDIKHAAFACAQLTFPIVNDSAIDALVAAANANVSSIGKKKLATVESTISIARVGESALGNVMADAFRQAAGTQIAFMNAGGLRTSMKVGDLLYENLFEITPFGNLGVVINALPWKNLHAILNRTIQTAGAYGTLEESGMKITYTASDPDTATQLFKQSDLLHVELLDGTVLFDKATGVSASDDQTFSAATLDFLSSGGDGYDFNGVTIDKTLKIARDLIADVFSATQPQLKGKVDGRFVNTAITPK